MSDVAMQRDRGDAPSAVHTEVLPWALVWRVAAGQILSWGILYYAFAVIVGPMGAGTGWSRTLLNAGLSTGLLVSGGGAVVMGAWLQRRGGRAPMTGGAALGGAGSILMGAWSIVPVYFVAWVLLGAAMALTLYESAFAVVTAAFGP